MLKVIKHEFKSVIIIPSILIFISLIYFLYTIFKLQGNYLTELPLDILNRSNILIGLIIVSTATILLKNTWNKTNLYLLSNVNERQVILARMLLILIITATATLIIMLEHTIISYLGIKKELIIKYFSTNDQYNMYGKTFASWFLPLATGFWAMWIYLIGVAVTPIARMENFLLLKKMLILIFIPALVFVQYIVAPLITNGLSQLNFNKIVIEKTAFGKIPGFLNVERYLIPVQSNYFFSLNNIEYKNPFVINIFSIGEVFFTFLYMFICYIVYSFKSKKIINKKFDYYKKQNIIKISALTLFVIVFGVFTAIVTRTPSTMKGMIYTGYSDSNIVLDKITVSVGDSIDLTQYGNLADYRKVPRCKTEIITSGETKVYDDKGNFQNAEGFVVDDNLKSLTMNKEGKYSFMICIKNKYINETYVPIKLYIEVNNSSSED